MKVLLLKKKVRPIFFKLTQLCCEKTQSSLSKLALSLGCAMRQQIKIFLKQA